MESIESMSPPDKPSIILRRVYFFGIVSSPWVLVDHELRPPASRIQCVAPAVKMRDI